MYGRSFIRMLPKRSSALVSVLAPGIGLARSVHTPATYKSASTSIAARFFTSSGANNGSKSAYNNLRRGTALLAAAGLAAPLYSYASTAKREEDEAAAWGWSVASNIDEMSADQRLSVRETSRAASVPSQSAAASHTHASPTNNDGGLVFTASWEDELARAVDQALSGGNSSSQHNPQQPRQSAGWGSGGGSGGGGGFPQHSVLPYDPAAGQRTVIGLLGLNAVIWGLWQVPNPNVQRVMNKWFLTSPWQLGRGFSGWASNFLANYSHKHFLHFAANMIGLYSFGPRLMEGRDTPARPRLTPGEFLSLYTAAGFVGSLASNLFVAALRAPRPGLGASGAIFGILTYFTLGHPEGRVLFLFFIEMSSMNALIGATALNAYLVGMEIHAARTRTPGPTFDGMAHLAGTAVGAAWYYAARASRQRKQRTRASAGGPTGGSGGSGYGSALPPQSSSPWSYGGGGGDRSHASRPGSDVTV